MSKTLKWTLAIAIFAGAFAIAGFVLGLLAYLEDDTTVETTQTVTLENRVEVWGATQAAGTFVPKIITVPGGGLPNSGFKMIDHGASMNIIRDLASWNVAAGTSGTWSRAGDLVYLDASVRWDLSGGLPAPAPSIFDELRVAYDSGEMWPLPMSVDKFLHFQWRCVDDLGNLYGPPSSFLANNREGQTYAMMLTNGTIAFLAVKSETDFEGMPPVQYEDMDDGFGWGIFPFALGNGASWIEFRVHGAYNLEPT